MLNLARGAEDVNMREGQIRFYFNNPPNGCEEHHTQIFVQSQKATASESNIPQHHIVEVVVKAFDIFKEDHLADAIQSHFHGLICCSS